MHADMWATSLPCDLLLDICRRLGSTSVICCAGVCRPWRRAIIDNASCLRPRPERFNPDLLLAFFDARGRLRQHTTPAGQIQDVPALDLESVVDVSLYHTPPLASRDGFLLLRRASSSTSACNTASNNLCLCNLLTGSCLLLPAAGLGEPSVQCAYVLATDYDDDDTHTQTQPDGATSSSAVRIVAVAGEENWMTHRIFSSTSGAWGPVKRSAKLSLALARVKVLTEPKHAVVCRGPVVYWLVILFAANGSGKYSLFAMDMRTERTWTTEVPELGDCQHSELVLATYKQDSRQPSLIASRWEVEVSLRQIEVWVLDCDGRWTLRWSMAMQRWILPKFPNLINIIWLCGFCPRSGCFFGVAMDDRGRQEQFIASIVGYGRWSRLLGKLADPESRYTLQYGMDWSTYISKMKYF